VFNLVNNVYLEYNFCYTSEIPKLLVGYEEPLPNTWNYFKDADSLFESNTLKNIDKNTEIVVLAKEDVYNEILITYLKSVLPNCTEQSAYHFYKLLLQKHIYLHGKSCLAHDDGSTNLKSPWSSLTLLSLKEFSSIYKTCSKHLLDNFYIKGACLELHLASYLANTKYSHKDILYKKLYNIVADTVLNELTYWKMNVMCQLFELGDLVDNIEYGSHLYENAVYEDLNLPKEYNWLMDENIKAYPDLKYVKENYDLKTLFSLYRKSVMKYGHNGFYNSEVLMEKFIEGNLGLRDIVTIDINTVYAGGNIGEYQYQDRTTHYLLRYFYLLATEKRYDKLSEYSLETTDKIFKPFINEYKRNKKIPKEWTLTDHHSFREGYV